VLDGGRVALGCRTTGLLLRVLHTTRNRGIRRVWCDRGPSGLPLLCATDVAVALAKEQGPTNILLNPVVGP
jgi:hypothetical protein